MAGNQGSQQGTPLYASLIAQMPYLQHLDKLRAEARHLRNRELKTILEKKTLEDAADEFSGSPISCVLFRRAKQLAWHLGLYEECSGEDEGYFPPWPRTSLSQPSAGSVYLLADEKGHLPVFFASQFLRARLGNLDKGYFTEDVIRCYYRIIREIYTISSRDRRVGTAAAEGSDRGYPTAFVTAECARALNQVRSGMQRTLRFLMDVGKLEEQRADLKRALEKSPPSVVTSWVTGETDSRLVTSLTALIENEIDDVFLVIKTPKDRRCFEQWIVSIRESVRVMLQGTLQCLGTVQREIGQIGLPAPPLQRMGHRIAKAAIEEAESQFAEAASVATELPVLTASVRAMTRSLVERIEVHLEVITNALESWMYRATYLATTNNDQEALEDLAFSADAVGSATQRWDDPVYATCLDTIEAHLDHQGRLPRGRPFASSTSDHQKHVDPTHLIRAIAHLIQHVPRQADTSTVGKLVRYFHAQLSPRAPRTMRGSPRGIRVWIRATSCIALHRIVQMLSSHLNHRIKACFRVRTPRELAEEVPRLEKLMWSDIGVTSAQESSESIHKLLCDMRRALHRDNATTRTSSATRSVLLYGPPGTGKSTLLESLALTSQSDLVVISPGDFLFEGMESLERQCASVMEALGMLSTTVILFDEFEQMIEERSEAVVAEPSAPKRTSSKTQIDFLTVNMLPKLSRLNKRAKENHFVYAAATNFVDRMDEAAIRERRFDRKACVFFPDAISRLVQMLRVVDGRLDSATAAQYERGGQLVCHMNFASAARLGAGGWFEGKGWKDSEMGRVVMDSRVSLDSISTAVPRLKHITPKHPHPEDRPERLELERNLTVTAAVYYEQAVMRAAGGQLEAVMQALDTARSSASEELRELASGFKQRSTLVMNSLRTLRQAAAERIQSQPGENPSERQEDMG